MSSRTVAPLAFAGAVLLALAANRMVGSRPGPPPPVRAILVDVSASVTRQAPGWSRLVRERLELEARAAEGAGERLLVVTAAGDVRRAFGPGDPADLRARLRGAGGAPFDPLGPASAEVESHLARGVDLVEELLGVSGCTRASLLVLGDDSVTGQDPRPAIRRLVARGTAWRGSVRAPRTRTDLALAGLRLPERLEPGAPLVGSVRLRLREGEEGGVPWERVELTATDDEGTRRVALPLPPVRDFAPDGEVGDARTATLEFTVGRVRRGRTSIGLALAGGSGSDPVPENDSVRGSTVAGEPLTLGWVATPELRGAVEAWLGSLPGGLGTRRLEPREVAPALDEIDALLVIDRSLEELPADLVRTFVLSGGGLLAAGGWNLLSGWDAQPVPGELGELLPLRPEAGDPEPREILVLVDGSGSMAGEPFELVRAAVAELVRAAPPRDEVGLAFFTGRLQPRRLLRVGGTPGSRADREAAARRLLDARVPGGPTRILDSLEQLLEERRRANDRALVLLLTDGREESEVFDAEGRAAALRERLPASGTELVVVAVGGEADLEFLRTLVSDESALHTADDLGDLGALFRREVNRERVREAESIELEAVAGPLASSVFSAEAVPAPLTRVLRMRLVPTGELVLASDRGEPVLACQRVGRGRTAVFASLPFADWGEAWSSRLRDLLPLLRWCARRPGGDRRPAAELEGRRLVVTGLDADAPVVLSGRLREVVAGGTAGAADPDASPLRFTLPVPASGAARRDRRETLLPESLVAGGDGALALELVDPGGGRVVTLPVAVPRAPEFAEPRRTWSLPPLAPGPGGRPGEGGEPAPPSTGGAAAIWLLAGGALLVFAAGWGIVRSGRRPGEARRSEIRSTESRTGRQATAHPDR